MFTEKGFAGAFMIHFLTKQKTTAGQLATYYCI